MSAGAEQIMSRRKSVALWTTGERHDSSERKAARKTLNVGESPSLKDEIWRPFPWNWFSDTFMMALGSFELAIIAPLMVFLVIAAEGPWQFLMKWWRHRRLNWFRVRLPSLVRTKFAEPVGRIVLRDFRNADYLPWIAFFACYTPAIFAWALLRHRERGFEFSALFFYHLLRIGPHFRFFAHIHVLLHKEGHDHTGFFKGNFCVFNGICQWFIGPFYGNVPTSYSVSHLKIHHRWHNDVDDIHTNLDLDRTKFTSFLLYVPRFTFYWIGIAPLALFVKRGERQLLFQLLSGMTVYYGLTVVIFMWDPTFCILYWVFPHFEANLGMALISYLWHAFVEESDSGNQYVNSMTIVNGRDNIFNEDYHVVHHHHPSVHWTDIPAHFEQHKELYAACTATIFTDTEQGLLLKWLFENNWDAMASHFVDLNGRLTHDEKKALLIRRLSVQCGERGRDGRRLSRTWASDATIRDF